MPIPFGERRKPALDLGEGNAPEGLVDTAKLRWRFDHDDEGLEGEAGLAHFEDRGWQEFTRHAMLASKPTAS